MHVEKCPVCNGVGKVSGGFYNRGGDCEFWMAFATSPEQCRSCGGKGYLVVPDEIEVKNEIQVIPTEVGISRDVCPTCGNKRSSPTGTGCPAGSHNGNFSSGIIKVR